MTLSLVTGFNLSPEKVAPRLGRDPGFVMRLLTAVALSLAGSHLAARAENALRVRFADSIVAVPPPGPAGTAGPGVAGAARASLTTGDGAAPMEFELMLATRNFPELSERLARGERVSPSEMDARYFPLAADYEAIVRWLAAQGFTVTHQFSTRLSVFARGSVNQVADVFQVTFARVAADGAVYTSAVTAPSVPAALAPALLGISGLQPHLRAHKHTAPLTVRPNSLTANSPPFTPAQILKAYGANGTGLTGAGQTIAIVIDTFPADSDLASFWSQCRISPQPAIEKIQVISGTLPADAAEATIDVELAGALAPAATVRIYATTDLESQHVDAALHQILTDLPTQPGLHQLNMSFGRGESAGSVNQLNHEDQIFALLAAGGVTVLASSGDGGSNPKAGAISVTYDPTAALQPEWPADDPHVTGVGGTSLNLDSATGTITSETAWSVSGSGSGGTGGGISGVFARPDWQTGAGVPTGTKRLVPDVSAVGDPYTGCFIIYRGSSATAYGGTSVAAPIWAGFCALLNQARATGGRSPLGLFGPTLYSLLGTAALRDITSGTNGAYQAGAGYDLVSGIGTPLVGQLVLTAGGTGFAPAIATPPSSQTVAPAHDASFSVLATGNPAPAFRWQRTALGASSWIDLADSATYTGAGTASLTVNAATEAMSGDSFRCAVTNSIGSATTGPAVLVVANPLVVTTLAGLAGTSGPADGTGSAARFSGPADLTAAVSDSLAVADTGNGTIRMVSAAGAVTSVAGQAGVEGGDDGVGRDARFRHPTGVAGDTAGNLYVADTDNDTIRKITPGGLVTTIAGLAGAEGSADGNGTAARFNAPSDVAVDSADALYVSDSLNHTVRRISPSGDVSTFAGLAGVHGSADGAGSAARFFAPEGLAVDGAGNLFVSDTNNQLIRKITAGGVVSTLAGAAGITGGNDGIGTGARFAYPADIAPDGAGNLFVIDTDNHVIRRISAAGVVGTVAGRAGASGSADGTGSAARFYYPTGIASDAAGHLYVADTGNQTIRQAVPQAVPVILTQPQSQTVAAGASVSFSVVAGGAPAPAYQWSFRGSAIGGATSAALTLSNVQAGDAGDYAVTASNAAGSVTSNPATLSVSALSLPNSSGGGSGGGAPSLWLCGLLSLLAFGRWRSRRQSGLHFPAARR